MDEATIRKRVCDEIEAGMTDLLECISKAVPAQSGALFGVALGMAKIIGKSRANPNSEDSPSLKTENQNEDC